MTNETLTRAAEVLERSLTLENQTLAAELRRFDTAQREALARMEAEHATWMEQYDSVVRYGNELLVERDTSQAQLAAARALIREAKDELRTGPSYGWEDRLASKLGAFLAQAEPGTALVMPGETVSLSELRKRAGIEPPAQPVWYWQGAEQQEATAKAQYSDIISDGGMDPRDRLLRQES